MGDANEKAAFDAAAFERLRDEVGESEARELLRNLVDDEIPQRLGAFQQCLSMNDHAGAARELRSLAAPAAQVGFARLASVAADLGDALHALGQAMAADAAPPEGAFDLEAAQRAIELACEEAMAAAGRSDEGDGSSMSGRPVGA